MGTVEGCVTGCWKIYGKVQRRCQDVSGAKGDTSMLAFFFNLEVDQPIYLVNTTEAAILLKIYINSLQFINFNDHQPIEAASAATVTG